MTAQAAPVVSLALAAGGAAWACRLYHADQDRCRLLAGVAVAAGVVLLNLGGPSRLVGAVGVPVVEFAHLAGWYLGPFALLGAAGYGTYRLVRHWWNAYPNRGLGARTATVLGSLAVGVAVGVLVRAAPLVSQAAGIAEDATAAGVRATARTLLDRVGGGHRPDLSHAGGAALAARPPPLLPPTHGLRPTSVRDHGGVMPRPTRRPRTRQPTGRDQQ